MKVMQGISVIRSSNASFVAFPCVRHWALYATALLMAVLLTACGTTTAERDPTADWTAEQLYRDAREEISAGNWAQARTRLESLESRYPFGNYAQQALMDLAYVNWRDSEPEQALATIDRFTQQYPDHPGTDYMLYLKGIITFTPPSAVLSRWTDQDPSERDPKGLRESYAAFNELVTRYPESQYATDGRQRMTWLVNTLAQNEVHVASYYYRRGAYVAAVNRAQVVLTEFDGVPIAEKALAIMVLSYEKLNLPDLASDARRVLDQNFPDSVYLSRGLDEPGANVWWNPINWF